MRVIPGRGCVCGVVGHDVPVLPDRALIDRGLGERLGRVGRRG